MPEKFLEFLKGLADKLRVDAHSAADHIADFARFVEDELSKENDPPPPAAPALAVVA